MNQNLKELAAILILIGLLNADKVNFKRAPAVPVGVPVQHEERTTAEWSEDAAFEQHCVKDDDDEEQVAENDAVEVEIIKEPARVAAIPQLAIRAPRRQDETVPWYLEPPYQAPLYRYVPRKLKRN